MNDLLLKLAGVIFLLSVAVMMVRMFFTRGSKLKSIAYILVYAVILFGFSRFVSFSIPGIPGYPVEDLQAVELQAVELKDYLADSKQSYVMGVQAFESRDYRQAIEMLSLVIPGDPNYKDAQAKLSEAKQVFAEELAAEGRRIMPAGNYDEAVQLFDQALTYNPDLVKARQMRLDAETRKQAYLQAQAAQKAAQELEQAKQQMGKYQFGAAKLGFAVEKIKVSKVVPTDHDFSYTSRGGEHFLWVWVSVVNKGEAAAKVGPENFYLSIADGSRIARSEATNSQVHLPEGTLTTGATAEGWVIFYTPEQKQYTLSYYGANGGIDKIIVP